METKRKALGKGLEELFNNQNINFSEVEREIVANASESDIEEIPISEIRSNPYQPRKRFDEEKLKELSESIKEHGLFQPIIVKKSIKGYELVAGERRTKAAKMAGFDKIPAIVRNFSDQEMMEVALLENIQRENLNPIEEAEGYARILEKSNITQEELSKVVSKSRSYITNVLGLVTLPEEVKRLVIDGKLSMAHARILSKIENDEYVISLAKKVIDEGINVRTLEEIARNENVVKKRPVKKAVPLNRVYSIYEDKLREKTGTKVIISAKKITIPFNDDEELNRILESLDIDFEDEE